ncbi:MAG: hypothetical protein A3C53_00250 [Omnitrophica WOR_2 bacterium RIFCSPHIGHO2_02_FULL_68_15]|nr:MAG: hypothetical protein A3C53_00250 [Omnitrophica WOR_2 bacterium RIFCSPHIGHO2_02_FULL_68_15]
MVNREGVLTAVFRHLTQEAAGLLVARSVPPEKGIAFANFGGIDQLVALPAPKSSERPIGPTPTAGLEEAVRLLTLRDGLPVAETLKTLVQELAKALDPMTVRFFSLKPGGDLPDEGIFGEALFFRDMDTLSIPIRTASSVSAVEKQLAKALKQDWERLGTFDPPVTHYRIYRMAKDLSCVPVVSHLASARLSVLARLSETHPEVFSMDEYAAAGVIRVGILPSRADLAYQLEIGKYEQLLSVIDESIRPRYAALTPAERRALSDLYGSLQILAKEADFQRAAGLEGPVREFGSVDELLEVLRKEGAQFSADDPAIAAARLADARAIDFPSAEVPESQWPSGSKSDGLIVVYTTAGWHETIRAEVRQWRPVRAPNDMWLHFYPEGVKVYPLGISPDRPLPAGRMVGIRPRDASPMAGMPNLVLANPSDVTRLNPGLLYSIGMNVAWNDPTFPIVSVFAYTDAQGRDRFAIFL